MGLGCSILLKCYTRFLIVVKTEVKKTSKIHSFIVTIFSMVNFFSFTLDSKRSDKCIDFIMRFVSKRRGWEK